MAATGYDGPEPPASLGASLAGAACSPDSAKCSARISV
jgi:hypothetical protein